MNETAYIKTACRACGQHIEAPAQFAGETVPCPHCAEPVTIPDAPPPPSPTRTQRITLPPPPAPHHAAAPRRPPAPLPPPSRPAPGLPVSAIPPTNTADAYLLPVLFILVGITIGLLVGTGTLAPNHPAVVLFGLLVPPLVLALVLGHLGAIAARLKTIEELLRAPRH